MDKFKNKYRIQSTRLQNWDYGWNAGYFVTICTANRECYFGEIQNNKMVLSKLGVIADILWFEIENHAQNVELDAFVVMPNHIHGIIVLNNFILDDDKTKIDDVDDCETNDFDTNVGTRHALSLQSPKPPQPTSSVQIIGQQRFQNQGKNTLSSIIGAYKSAVSKHAHRLGFDFAWQSRFHDHIIRNDTEYQRIKNYIISNPENWHEDTFKNKV